MAKDFGGSTKVITEILTKYAQTPKNHMQVLDDRELSLIFEHLTQHNQVSGIQVIFAEGAKARGEEARPRSLRPPRRRATSASRLSLQGSRSRTRPRPSP